MISKYDKSVMRKYLRMQNLDIQMCDSSCMQNQNILVTKMPKKDRLKVLNNIHKFIQMREREAEVRKKTSALKMKKFLVNLACAMHKNENFFILKRINSKQKK